MQKKKIQSRIRMEGKARRDDIVNSAIKTFAKLGFRAATIKKLAKSAGITEALVYQHFPSKESLYDAVLDTLIESSAPILHSAIDKSHHETDDRSMLIDLARELHRHYSKHPEELRLLLFSALQGHSLAEKFFEHRVRKYYEFLISRVQSQQKAGTYRLLNPSLVARAFLGMVNYHIMVHVLFRDRALPDFPRNWPEGFVDVLLEGIRK